MPTRSNAKKSKPNSTPPKVSNGHAHAEPELEDVIVDMARDGRLAEAATLAIKGLKEKGLPITFQRGDQIIRQYADGREKVLRTLKPVKVTTPRGIKIIEAS